MMAEEEALLGAFVGDPADSGRREALSQRAGDAIRTGEPTLARALEGALRHRERVERATHGFHTYPAGLHPDAARDLVALGSGPVLDPFCGGGTVLIEALLAGRDALGLDVSPVANLVARARTARTDEAERTALRSTARRATETAGRASVPPSDVPDALARWYEPHVLAELCAIQAAIGKDPLLRAVFSAILVKTSRRESDTSSARVDTRRPAGTTAVLFHKKAREYARMLEELAAAPAGARARVHREDARDLRERGGFGLVVTSPPYPGVYDYVAMQDLRHMWLGLDGDPMQEIGSRRHFRVDRAAALAAWRLDTTRWVRAAARALDSGGRMIVVIGDGQVGGRRIDTYQAMDEAASAAGLVRVARATVERWDEGVRAMRPEHAFLWERPYAAPETGGPDDKGPEAPAAPTAGD
jgi:SAM-dependent methyltransferase